jgi:hypothetical protein
MASRSWPRTSPASPAATSSSTSSPTRPSSSRTWSTAWRGPPGYSATSTRSCARWPRCWRPPPGRWPTWRMHWPSCPTRRSWRWWRRWSAPRSGAAAAGAAVACSGGAARSACSVWASASAASSRTTRRSTSSAPLRAGRRPVALWPGPTGRRSAGRSGWVPVSARPSTSSSSSRPSPGRAASPRHCSGRCSRNTPCSRTTSWGQAGIDPTAGLGKSLRDALTATLPSQAAVVPGLDALDQRYGPAIQAMDSYRQAQQQVQAAVQSENQVEVQGAAPGLGGPGRARPGPRASHPHRDRRRAADRERPAGGQRRAAQRRPGGRAVRQRDRRGRAADHRRAGGRPDSAGEPAAGA